MDVRVGAAPIAASAEMAGNVMVLVQTITVKNTVVVPMVAAPSRRLSIANSSLSAIPAPSYRGGMLVHAA